MGTTKRVQFLPEIDAVQDIPSLGDYTQQEILDSWYTAKELGKIALRSFRQASNGTGYLRGLEKHAEQGRQFAVSNIKRCIDAVMDEQDIQWEKEEDDYDRLADVSQEVSKFCAALALKQAEDDDQEARYTYQRMEEQKIPISKMAISKPIEDDEQTDETSICSDLSHQEID